MVEYKLRGSFVCNKCRDECQSEQECETDCFPRKQRISCLGPYCDDPCERQQNESDLTLEQLIILTKFLGNELNKFLVRNDERPSS
jgi:hypothetical protein